MLSGIEIFNFFVSDHLTSIMYDQNFYGGRGGGWEGGSSERCLTWGGGVVRVIKGSSKNILNRGWLKAEVVRRGRGF